MSTLELRHLSKRFPTGDWAVRDVDLEVGDGELFVIVGPSGCGKSTLLRMVAGLEDVTVGDVLIDHESLDRVRPHERNIAMAFQQYALYPHLTVAENIGFPMRVAHLHQAVVERRIQEVAAAVAARRRPRPSAEHALGWPAATRGDGQGDRARPAVAADGRADVEPRREAAASRRGW